MKKISLKANGPSKGDVRSYGEAHRDDVLRFKVVLRKWSGKLQERYGYAREQRTRS